MEVEPTTFYDSEEMIWSGPKRKAFFGPDITIGEVALRILSKVPDKVVETMESTGEQLTAAQLLRNGKNVARNFVRLGFKAGDVVGIFANNCINLSSVLLGSFLCGMPTNAAFHQFDTDTIAAIFGVTEPKIILCEMENYEVAKKMAGDLQLDVKFYLMNGEMPHIPNVRELFKDTSESTAAIGKSGLQPFEQFPCAQLTGDDVAVILCSSGTTGPPKGLMCSHAALINQPFYFTAGTESVIFSYSTLYWISGILNVVCSFINASQRIISDQDFSKQHFMNVVSKYKVTHFFAPPYYMAEVVEDMDPTLKSYLTSIDTLVCGGAKVPQIVIERWHQLLDDHNKPGFTLAYGFSEISTALAQNLRTPSSADDITAGEGKLVPNMKVRIMADNWQSLGPNQPGMLCVRPPLKWSGYYKNPAATAKAMHNGWIISGDIAFFDEHHNLHICSRHSDVFKSHGFQIYPPHIEEEILRIPGVSEACIFGVPDVKAINLIACAIVRQHNEDGRRLTAAVIEDRVREKMASHLQLEGGVYFLDALPKTPSGKTQHNKVLQWIQRK